MHEVLDRNQMYVTVDLLILSISNRKLHLLLSKRTVPPYFGCLALPGRFVRLDESAESTAQVLLEEMLPIQDVFLEQLYTFTDVDRDPRGRVISSAYLVIIPWKKLEPVIQNDHTVFHCYDISENQDGILITSEDDPVLSNGDLAFDHAKIIETGIRRLRGKIEYTDVGFHFLNDPDGFSLTELQNVFEAVLGKPMDNSNFRRFIRKRYEDKGRILSTEQEDRTHKGRPSQLYRIISHTKNLPETES